MILFPLEILYNDTSLSKSDTSIYTFNAVKFTPISCLVLFCYKPIQNMTKCNNILIYNRYNSAEYKISPACSLIGCPL